MKFRVKVVSIILFAVIVLNQPRLFSQTASTAEHDSSRKIQDAEILSSSNDSTAGVQNDTELKSKLLFTEKIDGQKLNYRLPFSELFKYDSAICNQEYRCYEIKKSLSKKYNFIFNFMSQDKYVNTHGR